MTTQDCRTFAASTMPAPAGFSPDLAWSQWDAEPHCLDYEPSSRWKWVLVIAAWAAGAVALAVVVGLAYVALAPQQQPSPAQQQPPMMTWISPNAGTIVPFPTAEPAQNT